jgi:hypothetical protein
MGEAMGDAGRAGALMPVGRRSLIVLSGPELAEGGGTPIADSREILEVFVFAA